MKYLKEKEKEEIEKEILSRIDAVMRHSDEVLEVYGLEKAKRCVRSVFWEQK